MSYTLIAYKEIGNNSDKHIFTTKTKRGVVGLMKTIMDNFDPAFVDVMRDDAV